MIYLRLFYEFFKVGLFSVGGGLATIPFLQDLGARTGWFTAADLADMIAVSESTPGPMGVNMSTYVGFTCGGPLGAVVGVLGLITPSVMVILIVAAFLKKFRDSKIVEGVFSGLRPASTALITSAGLSVAAITLFQSVSDLTMEAGGADGVRQLAEGGSAPLSEAGQALVTPYWPAIAIAAAVFACMRLPKLKDLHPILYIALAAVVGAVFGL